MLRADSSTTVNHTPVDKATSELLPSGSEDIALNLETPDRALPKSVWYARIEETVEPQESQCVAPGFECEYTF